MVKTKRRPDEIPDTFKAAVLYEIGKPLKVIELITPKVQKDYILIKLRISGVCRSQLMEISGERGKDNWLPHLLGHEGIGEVVKLGENVNEFQVGDKVILSWLSSSTDLITGVSYETINGEAINSGPISTFSEYSLIHKSRIRKIYGNFNDEVLALFGCAISTGVGMFITQFNPQKHRRILILGFGGIGSAAAIGAAIARGVDITIVESSYERIQLAKRMGFKNFLEISSSHPGILAEDFPKYDFCIESTGTIEGIKLGIDLLSDSGTLIFASHPSFGEVLNIDPYDLIKGKKIFGTWGGDLDKINFVKIISKHLNKSKISLNLLIGEKFVLSEINNAIDYLREGKVGRAMIVFGENN
jgi:S-(hydroxymethyl)glutathione dehydrogenase/alcohol dehydrogenase